MGTEEGTGRTLLDAMEASTNSFIRSVGVPSIQECSPRNPERPFSYTITAHSLQEDERREKGKLTLVFIIPSIPAISHPRFPADIVLCNKL